MSETPGDRIARALRLIRTAWPHMLDATAGQGHDRVTGTREPPPPAPVAVLSLRRETCECLAAWVRLVIDEAVNIEGGHMAVRIDSTDGPTLAGWLLTWADWLGVHDAGPAAVTEIEGWARRCDDVVTQRRRRRIKVGPCIDWATTDMGERVRCTGTLVAVLSSEDDLLPSALRCDSDPDHAYTASEWRRLGERIHSATTEVA